MGRREDYWGRGERGNQGFLNGKQELKLSGCTTQKGLSHLIIIIIYFIKKTRVCLGELQVFGELEHRIETGEI